ncbi:MAG: hypothetical protein CMO46_05435 [Verrucomicrobiales bacterium]|nr:hypothetical protein [Verrucomicrobiales bacterium]|tara:strand:- start:902 stop:1798 length:897 start_codon:yes stop_codon:yes gene_type:complete
MAIKAQSIFTYISNLEKENAALKERVKDLEESRDSLLQHIQDENTKRWDDYMDNCYSGSEESDDESVGSDSEEYESDSDSDSSTMAQITGGEPYESDSDATTVGKPDETEETDNDSDYEADSDCDYFISYNYDMTKAFDDLAAGEENEHKKRVYQKAANNIFHYPSKIKYGEQIAHMSGIGKGIIRKINEFLETGEIKTFKKFERNEDIAVLLEEYAYSAENPHRSEACEKAANAIRNLHFEVTSGTEISQGPRKVPGIGKGIANKIDEYIATGPRMLREDLDENLGRLNIGPRRVVN